MYLDKLITLLTRSRIHNKKVRADMHCKINGSQLLFSTLCVCPPGKEGKRLSCIFCPVSCNPFRFVVCLLKKASRDSRSFLAPYAAVSVNAYLIHNCTVNLSDGAPSMGKPENSWPVVSGTYNTNC